MSTLEIDKVHARLKDADESERRTAVILENLKGIKTIQEAAAELALSRRRFKEIRRRFLDAGRASLEPRPRGRPRTAKRAAHGEINLVGAAEEDATTPPDSTAVEREVLLASLRMLSMLLGHVPPKQVPSRATGTLAKTLSSLESLIIQTHTKIAEVSAANIDPKTGRLHQDTQREEEFDLRTKVLSIVETLRAMGSTWNWIAEHSGIPAATLRDWQQKMRAGKLRPIRRGRKGAEIDLATRQAICTTLAFLGPNVSLKPLLEYFPEVPRRFLNTMRRRFRKVFRARGRIRSWRLSWKVPRTVWSVDGLAPPSAMNGWAKKVIVVRDLGSRRTLELAPVTGESALNVVAVLETLFQKHGAPLVLKLDNGSGFISEEVRSLCARYQVILLFSPPHSPWYQGSIERGMQSVRDTIDEIAAREGRPGQWSGADLEVAKIALDTNPVLQAEDLSPAETWRRSSAISAESRRHFYSQATLLAATDEVSPANERQFIQSILVESGLLEITSITIPCRQPKRGLVRTVAGHLGKLATLLQHRFADVLAAVRDLLDKKHPPLLAMLEVAA